MPIDPVPTQEFLRQLDLRTIAQVNAIDTTLRRLAYMLARETLFRRYRVTFSDGHNKSADPKDWTQDFRELVLVCADVMKEVIPSLVPQGEPCTPCSSQSPSS